MLMRRDRSLLILSNMQAGILPILDTDEAFLWHACWLASLAARLQVPVLVMEHRGLGPTVEPIRALTDGAFTREIVTFSYVDDPASLAAIRETGRDQLILAGDETHISILQTALSARAAGFAAYVVGEACAARDRDDHAAALTRIRGGGVPLVTREMLLFEWIPDSEDPIYMPTSIEFVKHPHPYPRRRP
jgi:hypothetical protein